MPPGSTGKAEQVVQCQRYPRQAIRRRSRLLGGPIFVQAITSGLLAALRTRHDADRSDAKVAVFLAAPQ